MTTTAAMMLIQEATEKTMAAQMQTLMETDFSDVQEIPTEVRYQSSSIAAEKFHPEMVQKLISYKPTGEGLFREAKISFGMSQTEAVYKRAANDPRQLTFKPIPDAFRAKEYYGKPSATATFYKHCGVFAATEMKDKPL